MRDTSTPGMRDLQFIEYTALGSHYADYYTTLNVSTNSANRDNLQGAFDWIRWQDGLRQGLTINTALNFGEVSGHVVLESGVFTYTHDTGTGNKVAVRVSVASDPAYLLCEFDDQADGSFEESGRLEQATFNFILP